MMSAISLTPATLYCYYRNPETKQEQWNLVHLEAVHWEPRKAANVVASGLTNADSVLAYVWFSVDAGGKQYVAPKQYAALSPAEVSGYWTMTPLKDRMIKGTVADTMQESIAKYDDCFTIQSVDTKDFGSHRMRHFEVSGK